MKWSHEEVELLKQFYPKYGSDGLLDKLDRKRTVIREKARKLKIKTSKIKLNKENKMKNLTYIATFHFWFWFHFHKHMT